MFITLKNYTFLKKDNGKIHIKKNNNSLEANIKFKNIYNRLTNPIIIPSILKLYID